MTVERYEIKLPSHCVGAVDLADAPDQVARLAMISSALRNLGASPITTRTFALPAEDRCSVADLQGVLRDLFRDGDQMLMVGDSGLGFTTTALICTDKQEGITVRQPSLGQENSNGNPPSDHAPLSRSSVSNDFTKQA